MSAEQPQRFKDALRALDATPAQIADPFALGVLHVWSVDPQKVEKLMQSRKQKIEDGESVRDAVARHYGEETARIVGRAICLQGGEE